MNLQAIIKAIKTQTDAPIILYNLYNPFGVSSNPDLASLHIFGEQLITVVNSQIINPIAIQTGSLLADAYTAFIVHQEAFIIPGDVHPTLAGHKALAQLADKALLTLNRYKDDDHWEQYHKELKRHQDKIKLKRLEFTFCLHLTLNYSTICSNIINISCVVRISNKVLTFKL